MNSLPDQFNVEDKDNALSFNARLEEREHYQDKTQRKNGSSSLVLTIALVALAMNIVVFFAAADKPVEKLASLFGGKSSSLSATLETQQTELHQLQKLLAQYSTQLGAVNESVRSLTEQLVDFKNELINQGSRASQLERHYQELKADVDLLNKPKPAPKPIAIEKPKVPEKPPVLVSLISIRIQGGTSWISLREGSEISPLLAVGDEWHGAKLLAADPIKKEAQLFINGASNVVKL